MKIRAITLLCAATMALAGALAVAAADRKVTIVNDTRHTMSEFYASNIGANAWEEDILGEDELAPGESVEVDIDDGTGKCRFDFQGVFRDGDKVVKRNVNVCKIGSFTFTD
jgi:hypothetical protein